eukprot:3027360-Rhodomonas_salina.3
MCALLTNTWHARTHKGEKHGRVYTPKSDTRKPSENALLVQIVLRLCFLVFDFAVLTSRGGDLVAEVEEVHEVLDRHAVVLVDQIQRRRPDRKEDQREVHEQTRNVQAPDQRRPVAVRRRSAAPHARGQMSTSERGLRKRASTEAKETLVSSKGSEMRA